jgi:hypothetical protein
MIILNGIKIQFLNMIITFFKLTFAIMLGLILGLSLSFVPGFNEFLIIANMNTYVFGILFALIISFFIKYSGVTNKGK